MKSLTPKTVLQNVIWTYSVRLKQNDYAGLNETNTPDCCVQLNTKEPFTDKHHKVSNIMSRKFFCL